MVTSGMMPKSQTMGMRGSKKSKMHPESREAHHAMHEKREKMATKKKEKDCGY